jgi:hypothetical protein
MHLTFLVCTVTRSAGDSKNIPVEFFKKENNIVQAKIGIYWTKCPWTYNFRFAFLFLLTLSST